jgi:hypothetical protein
VYAGFNGVVVDTEEGGNIAYGIQGTPTAGWFSFQPLYDLIVEEQPELLD